MDFPETTVALLARHHADALADGALVLADPTMRKEAGCPWPVLFTKRAWERHVTVTPAAAAMFCDENGRLWDVLTVFMFAIRRAGEATTRFTLTSVIDRPRPDRCILFGLVLDGDEGERAVVLTAEEMVGEEHGAAINTYSRILGDATSAGEDDEDDGFPY